MPPSPAPHISQGLPGPRQCDRQLALQAPTRLPVGMKHPLQYPLRSTTATWAMASRVVCSVRGSLGSPQRRNEAEPPWTQECILESLGQRPHTSFPNRCPLQSSRSPSKAVRVTSIVTEATRATCHSGLHPGGRVASPPRPLGVCCQFFPGPSYAFCSRAGGAQFTPNPPCENRLR